MDLLELIASGQLDRRTLLKIAGATGGVAATARLVGPGRALAQEEPTLVTSIRSLSNPYHSVWAKGGDAFADSVGLGDHHEVQTTEGDSQKGIAAINAVLASSGPNTIINVDPNSSPDAVPIVEAVEEAGAWVVTHWNKPDDLHPRDFEHYVAHISYDGVDAGYNTANELFRLSLSRASSTTSRRSNDSKVSRWRWRRTRASSCSKSRRRTGTRPPLKT